MKFSEPSRTELTRWASLKQKKYRRERSQFLIEGDICVREALKAKAPIEAMVVSHEHLARFESLIRSSGKDVFIANTRDFARLSNVENSQGILAIGNVFELPVRKSDVAVLVEQVTDPGNCGTLLRTAAFFGTSVLILGKGSADVWNGKVVRGSMGAIFRQPFRREVNLVEFIKNWKGSSVAAVAHGGHPLQTIEKLRSPVLLVLGHETRGLSEELAQACTHRATLPGRGGAESLNLATATAVFLYEITR
ncbi:RNA methyltransferase [bacterium]|nr:RNA methyltransferase [bacterium]